MHSLNLILILNPGFLPILKLLFIMYALLLFLEVGGRHQLMEIICNLLFIEIVNVECCFAFALL